MRKEVLFALFPVKIAFNTIKEIMLYQLYPLFFMNHIKIYLDTHVIIPLNLNNSTLQKGFLTSFSLTSPHRDGSFMNKKLVYLRFRCHYS